MGDTRYDRHLDRLLRLGGETVGELSDEEVIQALAALPRHQSTRAPYLANVLASEAMNRMSRMRAAVMHATAGLIAVDLDGATLFANPAAQSLIGWSQAELRGLELHTLMHPNEMEPCALARALLGEAVPASRSSIMRKDGATLEIGFSVAPVVREDIITGAVMTFERAPRDSHVP